MLGPLFVVKWSRMRGRPLRAGATRFKIHCAAATFAYCAALRIVLTASSAPSAHSRSHSELTRLRAPRGLPLLPAAKRPLASRPADGGNGGGGGDGWDFDE